MTARSNSGVKVPVVCVDCGVDLGLGSPGAYASCLRCGRVVVAEALQGDVGAVAGALVAVAVGLVVAGVVAALLGGSR